jgi:hypothetical protein
VKVLSLFLNLLALSSVQLMLVFLNEASILRRSLIALKEAYLPCLGLKLSVYLIVKLWVLSGPAKEKD